MIVDGGAGLLAALAVTLRGVPVQRCTVHKLRNIARKAPKHAYEEIKLDYHRIVYADDLSSARDCAERIFGSHLRCLVHDEQVELNVLRWQELRD